jgi:hypothetical protein
MQVRFVRLIPSLLCAALFMLGMNAQANVSGPVVVLPNSYYLQPDQGGQTKLVKHDGSRLLNGDVAAYLVAGQLVFGAIGQVSADIHHYTNDLEFSGKPDTKYFILDTATGKLETDLDDAAWHKRLQDLGVKGDIHIYPPLPWQN